MANNKNTKRAQLAYNLLDFDLLTEVATEVGKTENYIQNQKQIESYSNKLKKLQSNKISKAAIGLSGANLLGHIVMAGFTDIEIEQVLGSLGVVVAVALPDVLIERHYSKKIQEAKIENDQLMFSAYLKNKLVRTYIDDGLSEYESISKFNNLSKEELLAYEGDLKADIYLYSITNDSFSFEDFIERDIQKQNNCCELVDSDNINLDINSESAFEMVE